MITLILACHSPADDLHPVDSDPATDADADSDTDADSDADADADSDADTDSGTPGTTGDTGAACATGTAADLVAVLEARDATGPCTVCVGAEVVLAALLTNPCAVDVTIDKYQPPTLLVRDWELVYPDGTQLAAQAYYFAPPRPLVVPAGGSVEQELAVGPLATGAYSASAELTTVQPFSAATAFTVP